MEASILHILRSQPDEKIIQLINAISGAEGVRVFSLYQDEISPKFVNWSRLVDDIFNHDKVICW